WAAWTSDPAALAALAPRRAPAAARRPGPFRCGSGQAEVGAADGGEVDSDAVGQPAREPGLAAQAQVHQVVDPVRTPVRVLSFAPMPLDPVVDVAERARD